MSACIDLHCHTTLSDGQCSPDLVCDLAQRNGIKYLAITDHNFDNPDLDALRARHPDLHILRGCEFSCMYPVSYTHLRQPRHPSPRADADCPAHGGKRLCSHCRRRL